MECTFLFICHLCIFYIFLLINLFCVLGNDNVFSVIMYLHIYFIMYLHCFHIFNLLSYLVIVFVRENGKIGHVSLALENEVGGSWGKECQFFYAKR